MQKIPAVEYRKIINHSSIRCEDDLQKACIQWFDDVFHSLKRMCVHHSPNGGYRNPREGKKFKDMGVRKGFPDLILFLPNGQMGFIELKYGKNNMTLEQLQYRDMIISEGHKWMLCRSLDEFITIINQWFERGIK